MKSEFTVSDFMSQNVVVAGYHNKFSEALKFFSIHGMRHLPIVNEQEELVGIVSLKDLIRVIYTETQNNGSFLMDELNTKYHMGDLMTKNPITVNPETKISDYKVHVFIGNAAENTLHILKILLKIYEWLKIRIKLIFDEAGLVIK